MKIPTIPYDKSLHVNYGVIISALTILVGAVALLLLRWPLWFAPLAGVLAAGVIGKLTEMRQAQLNAEEVAAGRPPKHSVESADIRFTGWGGILVALPALTLLMLSAMFKN